MPGNPDGAASDVLSAAVKGRRYRIDLLGENHDDWLELTAAGLAPDCEIELLSGRGSMARVIAAGALRIAIGFDLASRVRVRATRGDPL